MTMMVSNPIFSLMFGRQASDVEASELERKGAIFSIAEFVDSYEFGRVTLDPFFEGRVEELRVPCDTDTAFQIVGSLFLDVGFGYALDIKREQLGRRIPAVIAGLLHPSLNPIIRQALPERLSNLRLDREATPEDVDLCYRCILDRPAESVAATMDSAFVKKKSDVVSEMMSSDEFQLRKLLISKSGERPLLSSWKAENLSFHTT